MWPEIYIPALINTFHQRKLFIVIMPPIQTLEQLIGESYACLFCLRVQYGDL